jgi:hypothetical protein
MPRALAFSLLLAALLPLRARAQAITAAPGGEMSSLVGVPFDVPIYVDMTQRTDKLGSFAASVRWNPAVLHFNSGSAGTFGGVTVNLDSVAGVASLAGANPAGAGGMVTIEILHFTPLVAQPDTIHFAVTQLYAAGTFADLTPSLTYHDAYFCPARGMYGDIDRDGNINSRDALIALSNAVGLDVSAFDITLGDVDVNGVTNARDALIILSYAVGLPTTGFRVDRIAGGSCAASLPLVMAIVPGTVDLVVGQTVAFEARAADSGGVLKTVTDAIWRSGNTAALAVFPGGTALARATGTVRVTAVRGTLDSAQATVHIVASRTRQIVDALAANATNQLGSAAFPFATIAQGVSFAQPGDTVEVRVGRYAEAVWVDRPLVLMGDTLPDGTRPVIAPDTGGTSVAISLAGAGAREADYLDVTGYYTGVDIYGPSKVRLRGVRTAGTTYGVVVDSAIGSLRIEDSRLVGIGASASGDGVSLNYPVDTLVIQGTEISDFGYDGVYASEADSVAVLRSQIHDVGGYGIEASSNGGCGYGCDAPPARSPRASDMAPPTEAIAVDSSSIVRAGYRVAYLDGVRSAAFSHSRLGGSETGIQVYGAYNGSYSGWVKLLGDSVETYGGPTYYNWLDANYLDSLAMDSMYVQAASASMYSVSLFRVTNTQLVNMRNEALYGDGNGVAVLDNVSIVGDPACDLCAEALDVGYTKVVANRLTGINLSDGIYSWGDSSLTVTNSLFRHVQYPIEWYGSSSDSTSRLTVTGTTFSGFYEAINAYDGGLRLDGNTFQNGADDGVYFDGAGRASITRNSFAGMPYPVDVYAYEPNAVFTDTIADNVITDLSYDGIYAEGNDSVPFRILRNAVTCNQTGRTDGYGIELDYASGVVFGNQVNGCYSGISVYDYHYEGQETRADSVLGNTLSVPANAYQGIYVDGSIKSVIAHNTVTADTAGSSVYGDIYVYGYQPGPTATIDSNVVTGGSTSGIYVIFLDTALVRYNAVRGVKAPDPSRGGIVTDGYLTYLARIYGNTVRGILGNGMRIATWDTVMVQVDSNLVDSSSTVGIELDGGADSVTSNRITRSGLAGIRVSYVDPARTLVDSNSIVGNRFGLQMNWGGTLQAPNNWWGDAKGPQCANSEACDPTSQGDSVSYSGVAFTPFALADFGTTPQPARRFVPVAGRVPMIAAARTVAATGLDAPVARRQRPQLTAAPVPSHRAAVANVRLPGGFSPARAQAWQRTSQLRAAAATASAQRDQVRAARVAARAQVRQAQAQVVEQRRAQHEMKLKAKLARQAAARRP